MDEMPLNPYWSNTEFHLSYKIDDVVQKQF